MIESLDEDQLAPAAPKITVDDRIMDAVRQVESAGNPKAVSRKGAVGPFQLMPVTYEGLGLTREQAMDEKHARPAAKQFLQRLVDKYGSLEKGLAAYNSKGESTKDFDNLPAESKAYVQNVLSKLHGKNQVEDLNENQLQSLDESQLKPAPAKAKAPAKGEEPSSSALGSVGRAVARSLIPSTAGLASFGRGFSIGASLGALTGPAAPYASPILGLAGGVIASATASYFATAAQNRFLASLPDEWRKRVGMTVQQEMADEHEHPYATFAGEVATSLTGMRFIKPSTLGTVGGMVMGGGIEAGYEKARGKELDPVKIGLSAVAGALPQKDPHALAKHVKESQTIKALKKAGMWEGGSPGAPVTNEREFSDHVTLKYDDAQRELAAAKIEEKKRLDSNETLLSEGYQKVKEDVFHAWDQGKGGMLANNPIAQKISKEIIQPLQREVGILREKIKAYGVDVGEDVKNYIPRITDGETRGTIFDAFNMTDPGERGKSWSKTTRYFEDREAMAVQNKDGWRGIVTHDPEKNLVQLWHNGQMKGQFKVDPKEWKAGQFKMRGVDVQKVQATVKEIESHTNIRYVKDPVAALVDAKYKMASVLQNLEFMEAMKYAPEFKSVAARFNEAPKNWIKVEGLPRSFDNMVFAPRVAEALKDIVGTPGDSIYDKMGKISRTMVGTMFWNPTPHINNILWHAIVEKGLVGTFNPLTMPRRFVNNMKAMKAVMTQDANYLKWLRTSGSGMMSQNVFNRDFTKKVMDKLGNHPQADGLAKAWGYVSPKAMAERVMDTSRRAMWGVNDMILLAAYMDREAGGMTAAEAVRQVNKHIPNYKVPTRVMFDNAFGRAMNKALVDPAFIAFGPYEYGRLASYGHMVQDLLGKNASIKDRAHALDQVAMLAFATFVAYPMLFDPVAQAVTGNPNATAVRAGATSIPFWISQYFHTGPDGERDKDAAGIASSMFVQAPVPKAVTEIWHNRDLFSGKNKADDVKGMIESTLEELIPPYQDIANVMTGKRNVEQTIAKQFSISSPTQEQKEKREKFLKMQARAEARRKRKKEESE